MLSIPTSWPSGRCLTSWRQRKRRNSFVSVTHDCPYYRWCKFDFTAGRYRLSRLFFIELKMIRSFNVSSSLLVSPVFLTGCDRVPFLGMESIKMRVAVLPDASDIHLPESLTCHFLLLLPIYRRYPVDSTMRTRLLQAINDNRGFQKEDTAGWSGFFRNTTVCKMQCYILLNIDVLISWSQF